MSVIEFLIVLVIMIAICLIRFGSGRDETNVYEEPPLPEDDDENGDGSTADSD